MSKADASAADSSKTLGLDDTRGDAALHDLDTWGELESGRLIASSSGLRGGTAAVSELDRTLPAELEEPLMSSSPVKARPGLALTLPVAATSDPAPDALSHPNIEPEAPDGKSEHSLAPEFLWDENGTKLVRCTYLHCMVLTRSGSRITSG